MVACFNKRLSLTNVTVERILQKKQSLFVLTEYKPKVMNDYDLND